MSRLLTSRAATAALLSLLLVGTGASTASARPDPGDVGSPRRCHVGAELPAAAHRHSAGPFRETTSPAPASLHPLFILELGPLASSGAR